MDFSADLRLQMQCHVRHTIQLKSRFSLVSGLHHVRLVPSNDYQADFLPPQYYFSSRAQFVNQFPANLRNDCLKHPPPPLTDSTHSLDAFRVSPSSRSMRFAGLARSPTKSRAIRVVAKAHAGDSRRGIAWEITQAKAIAARGIYSSVGDPRQTEYYAINDTGNRISVQSA